MANAAPIPFRRIHAPQPATFSLAPDFPPAYVWPEPTTLRHVLEFALNDPTRRHGATSNRILIHVCEMVEAMFGEDLPLAALGRSECRQVLDMLRWVPANYSRRLPGFSLAEAVALSQRGNHRQTLKPITINTYMMKLRTLLNVALAEERITRNPALKLKLPDPIIPLDRRHPFSAEQLQRIFDAPLYRGCQNDQYGFARPGSAHPKRGRFWTPLIGLYSGLRLGEILQLDLADIRSLEGVDCFVVTALSESQAFDKRVKTEQSERIVPIHSALKTLGFLDYVREQKAKGDGKLFPELPRATHSGNYASPFSKWFRRFLEHAGADAPGTSFHSFRHNFRDALRRGGLDAEVALALGGWKTSVTKQHWNPHGYGSRLSAHQLAHAVDAMDHSAVRLSFIC